MICDLPNVDRAQLMCLNLADVTTPDACASGASITASLQDTSHSKVRPLQSALSEPVASISHGTRIAGVHATLVAGRCRKTRFRSNVQRKRFLAVHKALATYLAERDA